MLIFALLLQAASPAGETIVGEGEIRQLQMIARARTSAAIEQARTLKPDALHQALDQALSDKTRMIYQDGHGFFVEYTAPGGELRMWYPGNPSVVTGRWGVQRFRKKLVNACFRYMNAVDPVTGGFNPTECVPAEQTLGGGNVVREWRGDVFALMSGSIPYVKAELGLPEPGMR